MQTTFKDQRDDEGDDQQIEKLKKNLQKYTEQKVDSMLKEKKEEFEKMMKEIQREKRF